MKTFSNKFLNLLYLGYRYITPVIIFRPLNIARYFTFYFKDMIKYKLMKGSERIKLIDTYPILDEKTAKTKFDPHYFFQSAWTMKKIYEHKAISHVDVGSQINLIANLCAITKVTFIDLRPLSAKFENLSSKKGSILEMPYEKDSINSLSCLHVAEHIGLGRYGDPLDPKGTEKAAKELSRVLAKKGNLYFSLPIGKPRLCFNAHRIHSPEQILNYFKELKLIELSGVDDAGKFIRNVTLEEMKNWEYGCGLFHFTK